MKELKKLVICKNDIEQMSERQLQELDAQHGWFSDNIERFTDLNKCLYDAVFTRLYSLRSCRTCNEWNYFLPVKRLQEFIE